MKKTLLLLSLLLSLFSVAAQDTVNISVCTQFWKNNDAITATKITAAVAGNGTLLYSSTINLDSTQSCADFEFILSQYPADAHFAFNASKDQDDPLNGVTVLDMIRTSKHILGIQPLATFGMIAADVNISNSVTTFDLVVSNKMLLGIYPTWPNAAMWRFIPDYWLPFPNPNNPFQENPLNPSALSMSQIQALDGGTINIIGEKTGDVDGDANSISAFQGPVGSTAKMLMPDIILEPNVPTVVPLSLEVFSLVKGMQFELTGQAGTIEIDSITIDVGLANNFSTNKPNTNQKNQMRAVFLANDPINPTFFVHLKSQTAIALKEAIQLKQVPLFPVFEDHVGDVFNLILDFSNAVSTVNPDKDGLQILSVTPNPFKDQARIQLRLETPELVAFDVHDMSGKLLLSEKSMLPAGTHDFVIPASLAPASAMLFWRVQTEQASRSGKILLKN